MKGWVDRTVEERHLFNPAFCSSLIFQATLGASKEAIEPRVSLSFVEAFLVLPFVLHMPTRNSLPKRLNSSIPVWKKKNSEILVGLPQRVRVMNDYTREAIMFGSNASLFSIEDNQLIPIEKHTKFAKYEKHTTDEVAECLKKAYYLGRWFAHSGEPHTIFALLGIRP